ncbi:hypothetical protein LHP98_08670 [Rhodobacter sp. Har01]|uniref:hypothetical protein n=1 Tax=Rhodobacter sp. Har01 TaxID=2883999 RepID=UPI001D0748B1|nr:hypothetical protein [Rhodobacter sp. Har01]MCB6178202.1 hypothetical protein [Rhodobacter sp. Har01]
MGAVTITQMADRVASLLEDRLGISGQGLEDKLRRGGRRLPHHVRAAAEALALSALKAQNPKLLVQVDESRVARDYDICLRYLSRLGRSARRKATLASIAASIAFSLLVVAGGVIAYLVWRGYV